MYPSIQPRSHGASPGITTRRNIFISLVGALPQIEARFSSVPTATVECS